MKICLNLTGFVMSLMMGLFLFTGCEKDELISPLSKGNVDVDINHAPKPPKGTFFYALSSSNELIGYTSGNPLKEESAISILGLASGESMLAIDFRPATGQLYGVSSNSRLYIINTTSGATTPVGTSSFSPAINGTMVGFDFNPTVDRIRLVTNNEQNLRLNPESGAVVATDGNLNPGDRTVVAVAYTNSFAGTATTTLYDIDLSDDMLYKQTPPNNGTLEAVGPLGLFATGEGGFDISPDNSVAIAVLFGRDDDDENQEEFSNGNKTRFYYINLQTGEATNAGKPDRDIVGIAIPSNPVAYAIDLSNQLVIFNPMNPGTPVKKAIAGLQTDEVILGIDMRPASSQLYGLGSSSRIYTINMANGMATAVNATPFTPALNGSSFAFDFNPQADRIRVISNAGQNLRIVPSTGMMGAVDVSLNPGTPNVDAAAYANNFAGTTSTTLYDVDYTTDKLYTQTPPNNGTLIEVGNLNINADSGNGFDIGSTSGAAMAMFTTGSQTKIYSISLSSGAANAVSSFPEKVKGFTLGLGF
ncbi:MAG: DUF4394 domain-containing protein [Bacteroidota bacterium]|nr:DUF4394 domain-containing protein [Bacteroidota bacterium]